MGFAVRMMPTLRLSSMLGGISQSRMCNGTYQLSIPNTNRDIDRQYNERMRQLEGGSTAENLDASLHSDSSLKSPFADVLNLDALPAENKTQEVAHLKEAAEAEVKKAEQLGLSLKDAATDRNAIAMAAARPAHNVVVAFNARAKALENEIGSLQQQVKSQTTSADFEKQLHQCTA